jgi:hypothetical protein
VRAGYLCSRLFARQKISCAHLRSVARSVAANGKITDGLCRLIRPSIVLSRPIRRVRAFCSRSFAFSRARIAMSRGSIVVQIGLNSAPWRHSDLRRCIIKFSLSLSLSLSLSPFSSVSPKSREGLASLGEGGAGIPQVAGARRGR